MEGGWGEYGPGVAAEGNLCLRLGFFTALESRTFEANSNLLPWKECLLVMTTGESAASCRSQGLPIAAPDDLGGVENPPLGVLFMLIG